MREEKNDEEKPLATYKGSEEPLREMAPFSFTRFRRDKGSAGAVHVWYGQIGTPGTAILSGCCPITAGRREAHTNGL